MAAAPVAVRLRRTWPQRLLISVNLFLILALVSAAGGLGYFYWRFGQLPRLSFGEGILDPEYGPAFNVLLVGSDDRSFITNEKDAASFGKGLVSGKRSDTMMILRVDPAAKKARILSIPRDLWVDIADVGYSQRINVAIAGGPPRLIHTIRQNLGIQIQHYVEVDFAGFRDIVKVVGGVPVYFPAPARDRYSGLNIRRSGCIVLQGDQALSYVRSRHYQSRDEAGYWRTDPRSDLSRIDRQQDFIRRMIRKVVRGNPLNLGRVNRLIEAGIRNVEIDDKLSFNDLLRLATRFKSLDPSKVEMLTVPTYSYRGPRGESALKVDAPKAGPILAKFKPAPPPAGPAQPAETRLRVLNGNGTAGLAGTTVASLQGLGFQVAASGNADSFDYGRTLVRYAPGQRNKAALVASYLYSGADLVEDTSVIGLDVELVAGGDFAGVAPKPVRKPAAGPGTSAPKPGAPTTTAKPPVGPASRC